MSESWCVLLSKRTESLIHSLTHQLFGPPKRLELVHCLYILHDPIRRTIITVFIVIRLKGLIAPLFSTLFTDSCLRLNFFLMMWPLSFHRKRWKCLKGDCHPNFQFQIVWRDDTRTSKTPLKLLKSPEIFTKIALGMFWSDTITTGNQYLHCYSSDGQRNRQQKILRYPFKLKTIPDQPTKQGLVQWLVSRWNFI